MPVQLPLARKGGGRGRGPLASHRRLHKPALPVAGLVAPGEGQVQHLQRAASAAALQRLRKNWFTKQTAQGSNVARPLNGKL